MAEAIRRNSALVIGLALAGLIFAMASGTMTFHTGAAAASLIQAESPLMAGLAVIIALALALVIACVVGRMVNAVVGLFVLGGGLFVLAGRSGTIESLVFGGGSLSLLALESLLWAGLVLLAAVVVFKVAGPLQDIEPEPSGRRPHWLMSNEALICAGAGVLVLPVVWVIAQSPMKGQVVAAATLGSVAAGLAGRLLSPHVQPILLFGSVCVFAGIGHMVGWAVEEDIQAAIVAGTANPWSLPMPVDYAAGSLLGVALGLGWAKSFLHHEE